MDIVFDFNKSNVCWETKENSLGRFTLESILVVQNHIKKEFLYSLSPVMAGNVYSKEELPKIPSYLFQAVFSSEGYCKIFREYTDKCSDTIYKTEDRFLAVKFQIVFANNATEINFESSDSLEKMMYSDKTITGVTFFNDNGIDYSLYYPIKHVNVLKGKKQFQIETGQVIYPHSLSDDSIEKIRFAHLYYNKTQESEFLIQSERDVAPLDTSVYRKIKCLNKMYCYE